ncbi:MAG: hypothetical protein SGJ01_07805 [Gemmatimonadota bacterium]|nr:hypothetical protein [Gemmatimonadota bacterium]
MRFAEIAVVGGGCYGTFYAGQLLQARARDKVEFTRLLVVDRDPHCQFSREIGPSALAELVISDWDGFFDSWLSTAAAGDPPSVIVPSPLMPHLMYHWLLRRAQARWPGRLVETRAVPRGPGTPYDRAVPDGTRYVSFADWLCPTHCIEPALCPVTRAPRTWEMADALRDLTTALGEEQATAGPVLFSCEHQAFGVGTFSVAEVLAGDALVAAAGSGGTAVAIVVGTISSCHGAVNLLHLGPG